MILWRHLFSQKPTKFLPWFRRFLGEKMSSFRFFTDLYEVNSCNRKWLAHRGLSKIFFLDHFSPQVLGQNAKILPIFHFDRVYNAMVGFVLYCVWRGQCWTLIFGILGQVRVFPYNFFFSLGFLPTLISRGLKGFWIIEKKIEVMLEKWNISREMLLSDLHPKVIWQFFWLLAHQFVEIHLKSNNVFNSDGLELKFQELSRAEL